MAAVKSSFLDKVLGRIGRLDTEGLQSVVQRLARERTFLETLFNTIEDGVLVADEHGRVIYFNQAVTRLIGLQPGAEDLDVADILPEVNWKNISRADQTGGLHFQRHEFEVHYPRPRFLRLYAAPLDGEAMGSSGVALILHDATEARQKTFEAIESERVQTLTLLAASVAHEIGNPLNALHIHLQLMEREIKKLKGDEWRVPRAGKTPAANRPPSPLDAALKLEQYLEVAKGEINRLDYIVTQFLGAIRPAPLQLKLSSLNEVVEKTLELLRPDVENRGITVKSRLARHLTPTPVDGAQLQQVLVNLVKNAAQAMTTGGILTLQTGETSDDVWISVTDTGGGIPQEQINRIFEPFYTTKKKGTGLGLMIVQRIVRAHNGRIELDSHVGRGTTFRIWLPLHERKPRLLEARTQEQPSTPST
jgi:PAS domain S-box-containing protein